VAHSVLVLDIEPQTLAVVRSLGRAGFDVVLGRPRSQEKSEAECSRYCSETWLHPDFEDLNEFDKALAAMLDDRPGVQIIFPVAEPGMEVLLQVGCLQDRSIDVVMPPADLFHACRNKSHANELAKDAGLRVPESRLVDDFESLQQASRDMQYPLIIKSVRSEALVHGRKAYLVRSEEEFNAVFFEWPAEHRDLLVQRYIEGPMQSSQFVASNGVLVGHCEVDVVRSMLPDDTGLGIEFESVPPTPDLLESARKFVRIHDYSGPGLLQFIRESHSNLLYFLENNPRLGGGIAHTMDSGVDCPLLALRAASKEARTLPEFRKDPAPYRFQYRTHWLRRDLSAWRALRPELSFGQSAAWLWQMTRSFVRANGHVNWQWRDPWPAFLVYGRLFKAIFKRSSGSLG